MPCVNHAEVLEGLNRCSRCGQDCCGDCLVELKGGFYCAACKVEQVRDIQSGVDADQVPLATTQTRMGANMLDGWLLLIVVELGGALVLRLWSPSHLEIGYVILTFVVFPGLWMVYEALFLQWKGQTLGKMAVKIRVVTADWEPLSAAQAWTRAAIRFALFYLVFVDYVPAFFTKQRTAIHDLVAKTRVMKTRV